jgi:hypothetical protein
MTSPGRLTGTLFPQTRAYFSSEQGLSIHIPSALGQEGYISTFFNYMDRRTDVDRHWSGTIAKVLVRS